MTIGDIRLKTSSLTREQAVVLSLRQSRGEGPAYQGDSAFIVIGKVGWGIEVL